MSEPDIFKTKWYRRLMEMVDRAVKLHKAGKRREANRIFYKVKVIFDKRIPNPL